MPPKRTRAHTPPTARPTKKKNMRNIDLFLDNEADEASSGHNSDAQGSQKSEYSLAHLGESTLTEDDDDDVAGADGGDIAVTADSGVKAADQSGVEASAQSGGEATTTTAIDAFGAIDTTFESFSASTLADTALPVPESAIDKFPAAATVNPPAPAVGTPVAITNSSPVIVALPVARPVHANNTTTVDKSAPVTNSSAIANSSAPANLSSAAPLVPPVAALDPNTDWGYGPKLNKRINRLMTFANADELIYDIMHIPVNAQVAAIEDVNGDETYLLAVPGRKIPITIWFLGTVTRTYFRDRDGNLPKSISVNVRALHDSSLTAANSLLRTFSTFGPGENPEHHDTVRASRWMNTKRPGDIADHIDEFRAVYDAKNAFLSPRTRMATVFPPDIKKGDLVLLELHLGRYRKALDAEATSAKSSPNRRKGNKSDTWAAFFTLKSVCLLDDTPRKVAASEVAQYGTWEL